MTLFIAVLFVGCAHIAPMLHDFAKTKTTDVPFETVWNNIIGWMTDRMTTPVYMDHSSGFIVAYTRPDTSYCDCGWPRSKIWPTLPEHGLIFIHLVSDAGLTRITINTRWEPTKEAPVCYSTGKLEEEVFQRITSK